MQLEDWLDDLCVRFIINLPPEELVSVERICFQVEEAQWFYEDFIRPLDPTLPSLPLRQFALRMFQHCPLFSQWSAEHHMAAFAEFLAYKQRVPVRGAIMMNEAMDEVVLVKGWKKAANWSFPRGKINKDEDDLDCAVREVYEETGFDIKAAGLVKPEKDMKYIEVTMREQHMKLYVFRGVPKETHFEPRTRKEISKIEWYKLTDLPTQRKKKEHDGQESLAMNANKFYMVAPFLHPLKKWISQQKKKENRHSSNLAAPPILAEESATEHELYVSSTVHGLQTSLPNVQSGLPELAATQQQPQISDPSAHLKELLKIGDPTPAYPVQQSVPSQAVDTAKSTALLALLRNGLGTNTARGPPVEKANHTEGLQTPLYESQATPMSSESSQPPVNAMQQKQQDLLRLFTKQATTIPHNASAVSNIPAMHERSSQATAPYQRTGDPQFSRQSLDDSRTSIIPPANALPNLTIHAKSLLDAFKSPAQPSNRPSQPLPYQTRESSTMPVSATQIPSVQQSLLDAFRTAPAPAPAQYVPEGVNAAPRAPESAQVSMPAQSQSASQSNNSATAGEPIAAVRSPQVDRSTSLLDLFKRPAEAAQESETVILPQRQNAPAELAAGPVDVPKVQPTSSQNEMLAALFRKDHSEQPKRQRSPVIKAGHTGATIDAPLNQPQYEAIARPVPPPETIARRSPRPSNRTLFDPKQPTPVKILSRQDNKQTQSLRSSRPPKTTSGTASPKTTAQSKEKPFQPQILRRPQTAGSSESLPASPTRANPAPVLQQPSSQMNSSFAPSLNQQPVLSLNSGVDVRQPSQQPISHRENLLSLFGGPPTISTTPKVLQRQISTSPGLVSPTAPSQLVSPMTEEPISTRSRVGSLASITSGGGTTPGGFDARSKIEKRQTPAGDKAFLLGYLGNLGRIAKQEG